MSKQSKTAVEVKEKVLGTTLTATPEGDKTQVPAATPSILDPNLGEEPGTQEEETETEESEEASEEVLYTLRDNALNIPGFGTITKNPADPKPLSEEQLEALFSFAGKNGLTKEVVIKKHLVRVRLAEVKEIQPAQTAKIEKYVIDKE